MYDLKQTLPLKEISLSAYPSSTNPTQAPIVTQIGNGTHCTINITNSIPSGVSGDLGYSTIIVRVLDLSSTTQDDFTYYVLVSDRMLVVHDGSEIYLVFYAHSAGCRKMDLNLTWCRSSVEELTYRLLSQPISPQYQAIHQRLL